MENKSNQIVDLQKALHFFSENATLFAIQWVTMLFPQYFSAIVKKSSFSTKHVLPFLQWRWVILMKCLVGNLSNIFWNCLFSLTNFCIIVILFQCLVVRNIHPHQYRSCRIRGLHPFIYLDTWKHILCRHLSRKGPDIHFLLF